MNELNLFSSTDKPRFSDVKAAALDAFRMKYKTCPYDGRARDIKRVLMDDLKGNPEALAKLTQPANNSNINFWLFVYKYCSQSESA